mgnify:CR=1 FL=1
MLYDRKDIEYLREFKSASARGNYFFGLVFAVTMLYSCGFSNEFSGKDHSSRLVDRYRKAFDSNIWKVDKIRRYEMSGDWLKDYAKKEMTFNAILEQLGQPDELVESGSNTIIVYQLLNPSDSRRSDLKIYFKNKTLTKTFLK